MPQARALKIKIWAVERLTTSQKCQVEAVGQPEQASALAARIRQLVRLRTAVPRRSPSGNSKACSSDKL